MEAKSNPTQAKGEQNITPNPGEIKDIGDIANFVQTLLQQVQDKFQVMSDQILNRIDEMGHRIDDLEQNLNEVMQQAGITDDGSAQITKSSSMPGNDQSSISGS